MGTLKLRVSKDLVLGPDFVVSTAGIFATKGMGKSHLAQTLAEELLAHGQVIVAIDPTDAWWGLRAGANGKSTGGYPVVVIGGDHGDLKLEPGGAVQLAEAIVAERFSCVICTDGLSDMAETKFIREFLDTIYRRNRKPIHIFVDEADVFAPQKAFDVEDNRCIRAMSHIVRRGRKKGIGSTLITQRPAELNASVRTMVEMLFVLGMSHNLDIDAVEKWLRLRKKKRGKNAAYELQEEMIESLDSLQRGDAWVWAPRLKIHKRFRARAKQTFDSGATPKPGQRVREPKKLAAVDLQRLGKAMADAVARQKDSDPSELKKQVFALRKELEQANQRKPTKEREVTKTVEVEVVKQADLRRIEVLVGKIEKLHQRLVGTNASLDSNLDGLHTETNQLQAIAVKIANVGLRSSTKPALLSTSSPKARAYLAPKPAVKTRTIGKLVAEPPPEGLQPAHMRLLSSIAWWESIGVQTPDLKGVAFIAKTSTKSSAFDNTRSRLRAGGYIDYPQNGRVSLTDAGRKIAPPSDIEPTNAALQGEVMSMVSPAVGRMLQVLLDDYPNEVSLEDFAERAETTTGSSAFDNNRSWLRARGLAEYPRNGFVRATELLFPEPIRAATKTARRSR